MRPAGSVARGLTPGLYRAPANSSRWWGQYRALGRVLGPALSPPLTWRSNKLVREQVASRC